MVQPLATFRGKITSERDVELTILNTSATARHADIEFDGEQLATLVCSYPVRNFVVTLDEFTRISELQASRLLAADMYRRPTKIRED